MITLVKALPPGRGDLLPLGRVGSRLFASAFLAFGDCEKSALTDEAKRASKATADFAQIITGGTDDAR
jgi:hypothetical protein